MNDAHTRVDFRLATPDYFETIGQPLVSGRTFRVDEPTNAGSRTTRRHAAPRQRDDQPVAGPALLAGPGSDRAARLRQQRPHVVHASSASSPTRGSSCATRCATSSTCRCSRADSSPRTGSCTAPSSPDAMERQIRDAIHAIDPEQPVENFRMLSDVRSASLASPTVTATLLGLFGLLALVITAAGIAGVVAFSVNQRTQEFGIRMALGAARTNVLSMVLRQGLRLVAVRARPRCRRRARPDASAHDTPLRRAAERRHHVPGCVHRPAARRHRRVPGSGEEGGLGRSDGRVARRVMRCTVAGPEGPAPTN